MMAFIRIGTSHAAGSPINVTSARTRGSRTNFFPVFFATVAMRLESGTVPGDVAHRRVLRVCSESTQQQYDGQRYLS
jgi:hypothetical protein